MRTDSAVTTTPRVDITLEQPSVCMARRRPVTVGIEIVNQGEAVVELILAMRGRLAALASIDPDRFRLVAGERQFAEVTFWPGHGPHVPTGPMPYAVSATSVPEAELLTVVFGLVDLHEQRPGRPFGAGTPCIRTG